MQLVGPLPREIFSAAAFSGRTAAVDDALRATDTPVAEDDCPREGAKLWGAGNPFRRSVKIERECGAHDVEAVRYTNVCCFFDLRMGGHVCVGFLAPARVSRGYGVPLALLKSSRSRVPRTHAHTRWGRRAFCGSGIKKRGRGSRGCGRQRDGVQGAACCGRARRRVPGRGLAMWAPQEPAGREGGRNVRGAARGAATENALLLGASFFCCFVSSPRAGEEFVWAAVCSGGCAAQHHRQRGAAAAQ
ncbi:uncharacterized protein Tco025E_09308 [Trypanosoma conorhini]|uniref:Uncharacterized protein n=1 Tax=Trypanosoma conorhini TaxID=83891 RepID=A0A3R7JZT0_9TRYP|nr:uncharacterized protein Tco025E_09308 [Trypanosoma conorhini]RNE98066.1 hypothetical protein Tco025E_09308 [Trypanosoma conorhini]